MRHLTEEELVEHYFSDDPNRVLVESHLRTCIRCEQLYEEFSNALAIRPPEPPTRPPSYGEEVWEVIRKPLKPFSKNLRRRCFLERYRWALDAAFLLFLVAIFISGAVWQRMYNHGSTAAMSNEGQDRVIRSLLKSHLEGSERLLVQLRHVDPDNEMTNLSIQTEARHLLSDNRLLRQMISDSGDPLLAGALDHLERVLLEIANSPNTLDGRNLKLLERNMNTDSLLFEIRVLQTRVPPIRPNEGAFKGVTI